MGGLLVLGPANAKGDFVIPVDTNVIRAVMIIHILCCQVTKIGLFGPAMGGLLRFV